MSLLVVKLLIIITSVLNISSSNELEKSNIVELKCTSISNLEKPIQYIYEERYIDKLNKIFDNDNKYSLIIIIPNNIKLTSILFQKVKHLFSIYKANVDISIYCSNESENLNVILIKNDKLIASNSINLSLKIKQNLKIIKEMLTKILDIINDYENNKEIRDENINSSFMNQAFYDEISKKLKETKNDKNSQIAISEKFRLLKENENGKEESNKENENVKEKEESNKENEKNKDKIKYISLKPLSVNLIELRKLEEIPSQNKYFDNLIQIKDSKNKVTSITNSKILSNKLVDSYKLNTNSTNPSTNSNSTVHQNKGLRFLKIIIIIIILIFTILILIRFSLIWASESLIEINKFRDNDRKLVLEKIRKKNISIARLEF